VIGKPNYHPTRANQKESNHFPSLCTSFLYSLLSNQEDFLCNNLGIIFTLAFLRRRCRSLLYQCWWPSMAFLGLQSEDQEEEEEGGPTTKKWMNASEGGWGWNPLKTLSAFVFISSLQTDVGPCQHRSREE